MSHAIWIKKNCTCISEVILASKMQNQNTEGAHVGKHMHLYEKTEKKNRLIFKEIMHIKQQSKLNNFQKS